jgi:hypothetical protein
MKRRVVLSAVALTGLAGWCTAARADESVWSVAGKEVLRMRASVGGLTPDKRVERLDERMNNILSRGDGAVEARHLALKRGRGVIAIFVRGELLVTITPEDAAANNTTREYLAHAWLSNLRKTLPLIAPRINRRGA